MKASNIETGMIFHDGSRIEVLVLAETKCFITVSLSGGEGMKGKSVTVKWNKKSDIQLWK